MTTDYPAITIEAPLYDADDTFDEVLQILQRKIKLADGLYDSFVKRPSQERTLPRTKALLQQLDIIAQEQKMLDRRVYRLAKGEDLQHRFITGGSYLAAYNRYIDMRANLTELIDQLTPDTPATTIQNVALTSSNNSWFKLEKLKPPKFDGNFTKWNNFKELYVSLIHNERMPTVQKFHFLRSSLEGEAFALIENLQITEVNYNTAWQMLQDRYEDEGGLVWAHLRTLFSVKRMKNESHEEVRRLFDQTTRVCEALKNLGRQVSHWSDLLVYLTVNKMDVETRKHFELHASTITKFPTFDQIKKFLEERAKRMSRMPIATTTSRSPAQWPAKAHHITQDTKVVCPLCTSNHLLHACPSFRTLTIKDRREYVNTKKLCYNCFLGDHGVKDCEKKGRCRTCHKKHHTMVCSFIARSTPRKSEDNVAHVAVNPSANESTDEEISGDEVSSEESSLEDEITACQANQLTSRESSVLLATALVRLRTINGRYAIVRALIDPGSELSFVSDSIARALRAPKVKVDLSIIGVGGERTACCKSAISCVIEPCEKSEPSLSIIAHILPKLTSYTRAAQTTTSWKHLQGLKFADTTVDDKRKIDLIIGADLYSAIILEGVRKGSINTPMAQETIFGWVVSGPQSLALTRDERTNTSVHHCVTHEPIDKLLQQFWELEDILPCVRSTPQDEICEKQFRETHSRQEDGRYVVHLPLKNPLPLDIGNSYSIAKKCLERQVNRFKNNPLYQQAYDNFLQEYLDLKHMTLSSKIIEEPNRRPVYLPHHAVLREDSTTSPLRVVFNASSRTTNGTTLNDHLYVGPQLLPDVLDIMLRWRKHKVALRADIEKMFRQILVSPEERHLQRILWLNPESEQVNSFELNTVTYGTAPAPFLANRVLKQLSEDEMKSFPKAAQVLNHDFYVDDVLTGASTVEAACELRRELQQLLSAGQFNLRKWSSSHPEVLEKVPKELLAGSSVSPINQEDSLKVLGVRWDTKCDAFKFSVSLQSARGSTKREILSTIARIFDPAGWLSPVTVTAKIIIQELWLLRLDWDDEVPDELQYRWTKFYSQLTELRKIYVPRYINWQPDCIKLEMHGFCDASKQAYAAAVYLRVEEPNNQVKISLIMGKSKVAPVKHQTIAKLELCAAHLLARVIERVLKVLELNSVPIYSWTDSEIVLAWLKKHASQWPTFIANRVSDIQTRIPTASWQHVPTASNPADCASRGILPGDLHNHTLWWTGPEWLKETPNKWPRAIKRKNTELPQEIEDENQKIVGCLVSELQDQVEVIPNEIFNLHRLISSWRKILRITAYCLKWLNVRKQHDVCLFSELIAIAKKYWVKQAQAEAFDQQLKILQCNRQLSRQDKLAKLHPFIDEHGILRVGGRIDKASIPYDEKHPIILPAGKIAGLIISDVHQSTDHGGIRLVLSTLMQNFWILNARRLVKSHIHKCVRCIRYDGKPITQIMAQLPAPRVTPSSTFSHTGVDYAGPVDVRNASGRGHKSHKGYIALFICLSTRAIHLELVSDYTSQAFLAAFDRFVARRGRPSDMYSDNGTTFRGAERELREIIDSRQHDDNFQDAIATDGIQWHFIPPHAPHFEGLWEAGVKSVKSHLKRILNDATPTFEELTTLLCRIECNLNSRPIGVLPDDPSELGVLTPGHFLIGKHPNSVPSRSVLEVNPSRLSRWKFVQQLNEVFWSRWRNEYLHTLQQRTKWITSRDNIRVNEVVLIKDLLTAPSKWPLARVTEVHQGDDGNVRAVTVKTATSSYVRPIVKIIRLETPDATAGGR